MQFNSCAMIFLEFRHSYLMRAQLAGAEHLLYGPAEGQLHDAREGAPILSLFFVAVG
jgi:hypothetical protein